MISKKKIGWNLGTYKLKKMFTTNFKVFQWSEELQAYLTLKNLFIC